MVLENVLRRRQFFFFQLNENVFPVFKPKRNLAFAIVEPANKELDRSENLGIISPTDSS